MLDNVQKINHLALVCTSIGQVSRALRVESVTGGNRDPPALHCEEARRWRDKPAPRRGGATDLSLVLCEPRMPCAPSFVAGAAPAPRRDARPNRPPLPPHPLSF